MTSEVYTGLKWGALLGGPLAILEALLYLLAIRELNMANLEQANACLIIPLEAAIPFIAGFIAARQSGEARSGLIAGITAGVIVALVNVISELIYPLPTEMMGVVEQVPNAELVALSSWILTRVLTLGFGALFGWLGGQQAIRFAPPGDQGR